MRKFSKNILLLFFFISIHPLCASSAVDTSIPPFSESKNDLDETILKIDREFINKSNQLESAKIEINNLKISDLGLDTKYFRATGIWKELIHHSHAFSKSLRFPYLDFQEYLESPLNSDQESVDLLARIETYAAEWKKKQSEVNHQYYLCLDSVSAMRGRLFQAITEGEQRFSIPILTYLEDFAYELKAIPIRMIKNLWLSFYKISDYFGNTIDSYVKIIADLFFILMSLFIPFFALMVSKKFTSKLDALQHSLWRRQEKKYALVSKGIQKIIPYLAWVSSLLALESVASFWHDTVVQDLAKFMPIMAYYIYYRIFVLAFTDTALVVKNRMNPRVFGFTSIVKKSAKIIGRFFCLSASALYIVDYCVGHVVVYMVFDYIFHGLGILVVVWSFRSWAGSLKEILKNDSSVPFEIFEKILTKKFGDLISVLIFLSCAGFVCTRIVISVLEQFEFFRTIFIKIYRTKIEMSQGDEDGGALLDHSFDEYREYFKNDIITDKTLVEDVYNAELDTVEKEIGSWLDESEDDHTIAIIGENGIGKTHFLNIVEQKYCNTKTIRIDVPARITSNKSLYELLSRALGQDEEKSNVKIVKKFNQASDCKVIMIVDNAHNLFISDVDGLTAFRTFLNLINLETENLFWVVSFNQYAYAYLKGVMGFAHHFREEVFLKKWSSESIQSLITKRHSLSAYKLSFEKIGQYSPQGEDIEGRAERQFHSILWEQSGGNPKISMRLWLKSLSLRKKNLLEVSLPEKISSDQLMYLDDNAWFILASIARHRSLSKREAAQAGSFPMTVVSHALKMCLDSALISKNNSNRYELNFEFQAEIVKQLKMKNFIYES